MATNTKHIFYKATAIVLIYCISILNTIAQDYKFNHITADQGLSMGSVYCILKDSRGFMWFGTQDGLNKYDGYTIKVFKHNPTDTNTLANNFIYALYEDKNGVLWIGTEGGGLDEYSLITGKFKHHFGSFENKNSLSSNYIHTIFEDDEGLLWLGTEKGLNVYNPKTNEFKRYLADKNNPNAISGDVNSFVHQSKNGKLWIRTNGDGLNSFDKKTGKFTHYIQQNTKSNEDEKNTNNIGNIYEDDNGLLWISSHSEGIVLFDTKTNTFLENIKHNAKDVNSLSYNQVHTISKDVNNNIWIGNFAKGIDIYNPKTHQFKNISFDEKNPDGLNNNSIHCIYHDNTGAVWVGTEGGGVNVYFHSKGKFKTYKKRDNTKNSLQSNTIFSMLEDRDGLLWIGTEKGGVSTLNFETDTYEQYPQLSPGTNNSVLSLCEDADGNIWVGTYGNGVFVYDKKTKKVTSFDEFQPSNAATIINIFKDSKNNIWVSTYGAGVFLYDKTEKKFTNFNAKSGLNSDNAYLTFEDSKHNIWIATDGGGVNKLDVSKKTFQYYTHNEKSNSLTSNSVLSFYEDKQGFIWIGTSNGLNKFNPQTNHFDFYFEKDGLPNDVIYCMLPDNKGNLWISTNKGVSKFNPNIENENGLAFYNYDVNDGLQGMEFIQGAYFQNKKGEMFLGGINGMTVFNPNEAVNNKIIPPVHIISYKRSGKEVLTDTLIYDKKYLELSWRENFFSFDFAALDYQMPGKNKYKYKLEGVDADWSPPSTQRYASYTQLSGGDYVFKVIASSNDGMWNNNGTSLIIHINPPFWKTNWFYGFCVVFIMAGFWAFFKIRTRTIKREKKILKEKVEARTIELAQKNKDITSSIQYAKRIQLAILPPLEQIFRHFPESFVFYKPKDIVSGDFYWFGIKDGKKIIAVVDCTGHGVPGAFMSMIGNNLLNQIIIEKGITKPDEILNALHIGVQTSLRQGTNVVDTSDGMDIAICSIESDTNKLEYAGAFRPLIIINKENFRKIDGDKFPIGGLQFGAEHQFTNHVVKLSQGDTVYLSSDGFADQFGGEFGKKFMVKRFNELLVSIQNKSMKEQEATLDHTFTSWCGDHQQVDDILVIGIRF